jgi:hypothetical protein
VPYVDLMKSIYIVSLRAKNPVLDIGRWVVF